MNTQLFKYGEFCYLDNSDEIYTIVVVSKRVLHPNNKTGFMYQLQRCNGTILRDGGNPWWPQVALKKAQIPSKFSFEELLVHLNGVVSREDLE